MKKFTFLLAALMIPFFMTGQDELPYRLFETMYMTPKAGSSSALKDALGAHNRKYHPRGTYQSQVYYVMNGPNAGKLVWSMGPTTWTQHENRPDDQGHTDDWDKNVSTLVDEMGGTDYWKLDAENSNFGGPFDLNKLQVWMVDLKNGQDYRASSVFKKVVAAMTSMDDPLPFGLYDRQLPGTHGYDLVMI